MKKQTKASTTQVVVMPRYVLPSHPRRTVGTGKPLSRRDPFSSLFLHRIEHFRQEAVVRCDRDAARIVGSLRMMPERPGRPVWGPSDTVTRAVNRAISEVIWVNKTHLPRWYSNELLRISGALVAYYAEVLEDLAGLVGPRLRVTGDCWSETLVFSVAGRKETFEFKLRDVPVDYYYGWKSE